MSDVNQNPSLTQVDDLIDLRELIAVFRRRFWTLIATGFLTFVAVVIFTLQATPLYTAKSSVVLNVRQAQVVDIEAVLSGMPPDSAMVDTEVEVLRSCSLAETVVERLDLVNVPEFNESLREPGGLGAIVKGLGGFVRALLPGQAGGTLTDEEVEQRIREQVVTALMEARNVRRAGLTYVIEIAATSQTPSLARDIAKENDLVLISDLAYSEIYFDGNPPPSILEVEGAREVAVEFTSMSKTYSMPGWRMGFAAGSSRLVDALKRVKSYLDYGAFTPIQIAAVAALDGPQDHVVEAREIYKKRRDVLVESFGRAGFDIPSPPATMFAWAPIPERFAHLGSVEFAKKLLEETDVAVAPGLGFGERGDTHVRLAVVENEQRIRQAARALKGFFAQG